MRRDRLTRLALCVLVLTGIGLVTSGESGGTPAATDLNRLRLVTLGSNFAVASAPVTIRYDPAVAYNSVDDEFFVVWSDFRNSLAGDIYGQRVTAEGSTTGPSIAVWVKEASQSEPAIAYNRHDNQYLVVWGTQEPGFFNWVRGRRAGANGIPLLLTDFPIMSSGNEVAVVHNTANYDYFVTGRSFPTSRGINAQVVSHFGNLIGETDSITSSNEIPGEAAYDSVNNRYLMIWWDQTSGSERLDGRFFLPDGTGWGTVFTISSDYPHAPQIAFDPVNHRFLVVFKSLTTPGLRGQLLTFDGNLIGSNFTIHAGSGNDNPDLVYSPSKRSFVVVWHNGSGDIFAKAITAEGRVADEPLFVASGKAFPSPRIAYNSRRDEFLVVWEDDRNVTAGNAEIFAQVISFLKRQTFVADRVESSLVPASARVGAEEDLRH